MMKKSLLINLPEDVFINNILLSKVLPIKSLLSLRCVCKYLRNLITSPAFIKIQLHHSTNNPLVLIKATHRPNVFFSLKFNVGDDPCCPDYVEFVSPIECSKLWNFCKAMECFKFCGSCNGLVCLAKRNNVCLWNPFTKEYKVLPPPLPHSRLSVLSHFAYGFGYDRLLDDYKIIRCSVHFIVFNYSDHIPFMEFQVYALGTNTWRKISNPYKSVLSLESSVFVNGAFHWVISTSEGKSSDEAKIVSFDIEKEVFGEVQTPSMLMAKFKPYVSFSSIIQVLRGCLCVVVEHDYNTEACNVHSTETCNVWMMMDYGVKESWTKLFTIFKTQQYNIRMSPESYRLLRFCENGTEILVASHNSLIVYDLINNTSRRVEFGEKMGKWKYQSEVYIESLVSLNSGVYSKQK